MKSPICTIGFGRCSLHTPLRDVYKRQALEFMIFSVDYSRTQRMQFEDDEYYYYVKAVPKIVVSAPEKTVKKINERQEWSQKETEEELLKQSLNKELGMENNSTKK